MSAPHRMVNSMVILTNHREHDMQIGDLPRVGASRPMHRSAVVQAMAVVLSIGFVLIGWLALSAPGQDTQPVQTTVAAARPQNAAKPKPDFPVQKTSPVQVAAADPPVSYGARAASDPPAAPVADVISPPALAPASAVSQAPSAPAAAVSRVLPAPEPAAPVLQAPPPEPAAAVAKIPAPAPKQVQASAGAVTAPAQSLSDITGAVTNQASVAAQRKQPDSLVDLNTASLETLNKLQGAGAIGRAIIKGRPYASAEELVTKKVIRRSLYEKIRGQVAVR